MPTVKMRFVPRKRFAAPTTTSSLPTKPSVREVDDANAIAAGRASVSICATPCSISVPPPDCKALRYSMPRCLPATSPRIATGDIASTPLANATTLNESRSAQRVDDRAARRLRLRKRLAVHRARAIDHDHHLARRDVAGAVLRLRLHREHEVAVVVDPVREQADRGLRAGGLVADHEIAIRNLVACDRA